MTSRTVMWRHHVRFSQQLQKMVLLRISCLCQDMKSFEYNLNKRYTIFPFYFFVFVWKYTGKLRNIVVVVSPRENASRHCWRALVRMRVYLTARRDNLSTQNEWDMSETGHSTPARPNKAEFTCIYLLFLDLGIPGVNRDTTITLPV